MSMLPSPIVVPRERLIDFDSGSRLEWLETDGRGGYAASTAISANTRRYHGLLVVSRRPPTDRVVLLSRLDETLVAPDGERYALGCNAYPGAVHPMGHHWLEEFRLDPWPVWRYRLGRLTLTRSLAVVRSPGATVIRYTIEGGPARLELRPLVAGRDFHALVSENDAVAPAAVVDAPARVRYRPYPGIPPLVLTHDGGVWGDDGVWYRRTVYPRETERGLEDREDLYSPGVLTTEIVPARAWTIACTMVDVDVGRADAWLAVERRRREDVAARGRRAAPADPAASDLGARLALSADAFLARRGDGHTILAGYPWFADWGRDAMISLPGLCLVTARLDEATSVLRAFADHLLDGLIPNRFPDDGGRVPLDHYNAADASLWFIEAVGALGDAGGDAGSFWPAVEAIVGGYRRGTHFGIGLEPDGLVRQGRPGVQLTWMDAKVDGWVVTPRDGRAIEINALWYNALLRAASLARTVGADPSPYEGLARRAHAAFDTFWFEDGGYLYDRIDDDGRPDPALRPNQLFAVSLPYSPLPRERATRVVDVVGRALLVPLGVRTLAPDAPGYVGRYGGGRRERDAAYHQGTAWPWLLGAYVSAWLRVHGEGPAARSRIRQWLDPLPDHLRDFGLGHVAEVLSGDPPHEPAGCYAQAWSTAELLRALALCR